MNRSLIISLFVLAFKLTNLTSSDCRIQILTLSSATSMVLKGLKCPIISDLKILINSVILGVSDVKKEEI